MVSGGNTDHGPQHGFFQRGDRPGHGHSHFLCNNIYHRYQHGFSHQMNHRGLQSQDDLATRQCFWGQRLHELQIAAHQCVSPTRQLNAPLSTAAPRRTCHHYCFIQNSASRHHSSMCHSILPSYPPLLPSFIQELQARAQQLIRHSHAVAPRSPLDSRVSS